MGIDSYSCIWALVLSDSSLVLSRRQAIIWTNADLSVIRWLTSNLEFWQTYFIRNNNWKISSVNGSHFVQVSKCWCYIFQLHTDGKITVASNHFAFTHNQMDLDPHSGSIYYRSVIGNCGYYRYIPSMTDWNLSQLPFFIGCDLAQLYLEIWALRYTAN